MAPSLTTPRLTLRPWRDEDAPAALTIYGHPDVIRWLSPAMERVCDTPAMRLVLQQWIAENERAAPPAGHWAIVRRENDRVIGAARLLPLPPRQEDLEIGWHLHPDLWGNGYATEAASVVASWAFSHDVNEIFAVVRPDNVRAGATLRRNGMEWVGETNKYFGMALQVFRLRRADLDTAAPLTPQPPAVEDLELS